MIELEDYVQDLNLPQIAPLDKQALDRSITVDEIKYALTQLNTNKCPGTDGLPPEFYSRFWHPLFTYLFHIEVSS